MSPLLTALREIADLKRQVADLAGRVAECEVEVNRVRESLHETANAMNTAVLRLEKQCKEKQP